jgi:hypothetical protein
MINNELERQELDSENDGYANEFQRAHAWARMTTPIKNERKKAMALVAEGKTVVLFCNPVYCRITDGILGQDVSIVSVGHDYESAVGPVLNDMATEAQLGDGHYEVLPHPPIVRDEPVSANDDIPF